MTPRRTATFPARLVIYGPRECRPYRMDLVVATRWIPFVATFLTPDRPVNPFGLPIDISTMDTPPPTTE